MRLFDTTPLFTPETIQRLYMVIAVLLFISYSVFMTGYYFFPDFNLQYKYFIRPLHALVLPGIVILAAALREIKDHPVFPLIIVYMLYMLASGLWSSPFDLYKFGQKSANALYILCFIVLTHFLRSWFQVGFDRMLRFAVLFAAVSAIVSMFVFYGDNDFPAARLSALGSLSNINEFANVSAVYALLAMGYSLKASLFREKAFYLFLVAVFISFIWFGQSRTAFVSLFMALCFLVIANGRQGKIKLIVLVVSTIGVLGLVFPELIEKAWLRGEGLRPMIWTDYLKDAALKPIFGQGLVTEISYDVEGRIMETAHNAYIQAFWHGGVIGLGLFLLLFGGACRQAWRLGKEGGDFVVLSILVFTMFAMMTGVDTLIARPRDQWMLFWFPLALLISYQTTGRGVSTQAPPGGRTRLQISSSGGRPSG